MGVKEKEEVDLLRLQRIDGCMAFFVFVRDDGRDFVFGLLGLGVGV